MNRREFFRRAALIAAGVVAADQVELLERLGHRKVFAGWAPLDIDARARFVEMLNQTNTILDDMPWVPAVRTGLPPCVWRRLHELPELYVPRP